MEDEVRSIASGTSLDVESDSSSSSISPRQGVATGSVHVAVEDPSGVLDSEEDGLTEDNGPISSLLAPWLQKEKTFPNVPLFDPNLHMTSKSERSRVLEAMIQLGRWLSLSNEALFRAFAVFDNVLSEYPNTPLHIIGMAAIVHASQFPDGGPSVEAKDVIRLARKEHLLDEVVALKDWLFSRFSDSEVENVTAFVFYDLFAIYFDKLCEMNHFANEVRPLGQFLLEMTTVVGGPILNFLPSVRAYAALAVAAHSLLKGENWRLGLEEMSSYKFSEMLDCFEATAIIWMETKVLEEYPLLARKYFQPEMMYVSTILAPGLVSDEDEEEGDAEQNTSMVEESTTSVSEVENHN